MMPKGHTFRRKPERKLRAMQGLQTKPQRTGKPMKAKDWQPALKRKVQRGK